MCKMKNVGMEKKHSKLLAMCKTQVMYILGIEVLIACPGKLQGRDGYIRELTSYSSLGLGCICGVKLFQKRQIYDVTSLYPFILH